MNPAQIFGVSLLMFITVGVIVLTVFTVLDVLHRPPTPPTPNPIEDYRTWKRERNQQDAVDWLRQWAALQPPKPPEPPCTSTEHEHERIQNLAGDIVMMRCLITPPMRLVRSGWDGRHHATCPYECDCPPVRRHRP